MARKPKTVREYTPPPRVKITSKCGMNESAALAPLRVTPNSKETARKFTAAGTGRSGKKGAEIHRVVRDTIQHGEIEPIAGGYSKGSACATKGGAPRRGQVDLTFPSRKSGLDLGPTLRFCTNDKGGFGPTIRVESAAEAKRIAKAYQECAADPAASLDACVAEATGRAAKSLAVGGIRTSRRTVPIKRRKPSGPPMSTAKTLRTFPFKFPWQRR